jgi:hypothetical protein
MGGGCPFTYYRILLDNYYLPGDLERQIGAVIECCNHVRYREASTTSHLPTSILAATILAERQRIKRQTIANRRLAASTAGCLNSNPDEPPRFASRLISLESFDDGHPATNEVRALIMVAP